VQQVAGDGTALGAGRADHEDAHEVRHAIDSRERRTRAPLWFAPRTHLSGCVAGVAYF
jgi:hypothetical protein